MIKDGTTPKVIYVQENMGQQIYGVNQDGTIEGMVKYYREDAFYGYNTIRKALALAFMRLLDSRKPADKICLSNAECFDIEKAFEEKDFTKLERYLLKYSK